MEIFQATSSDDKIPEKYSDQGYSEQDYENDNEYNELSSTEDDYKADGPVLEFETDDENIKSQNNTPLDTSAIFNSSLEENPEPEKYTDPGYTENDYQNDEEFNTTEANEATTGDPGVPNQDQAINCDTSDSNSEQEGGSVKKYRTDMKKCILCGLAVFLALCAVAVAAFCIIYFLGPKHGTVKTSVGQIRGTVVDTNQGLEVEQYLGIPFAEKPIKELRYSDPRKLDKLPSDPYDANDYKFSCMYYLDTTYGDFQGSAMWNAPNAQSEDCLYLNVWVPKQRDRLKKLPVMVWIYGGGFFSGSNALWVYDAKDMAAYSGMIIASFNYRVGTFGYLSTGDGRIKGNFGMKDQVMALQWIHDHIEAFGGDPERVTIFGESSGASSAGLHMMSDHSDHLFNRAIFQSGSPDSHWSFMTNEMARNRSKKFLEGVQCSQNDADELLACLREKDVNTILENEWVDVRFMAFPWVPSIDGDFLVDSPYNLLHQGKFKKKEALLGVNRDEGTYWLLYALPGFSKDNSSPHNYTMFRDGVDIIDYDLSNQTRDEIKSLYTPLNYQNDVNANRDSLDKVAGDRSFTCPTRELARIYTESGITSYFYYLTHRATNEVWPPWMGVIHGAEIQWVFGMPFNESRGYTADELEFSKSIISYWTNFAKNGDPNGAGLPTWPKYDPVSPEIMEFRNAPNDFYIRTELQDKYCRKWMEINDKIQKGQPV